MSRSGYCRIACVVGVSCLALMLVLAVAYLLWRGLSQLNAAEKKLEAVAKAVSRKRQPLRGKEQIGLRIGRELKSTKMQKHFELTIGDDTFSYRRHEEQIAAEAALDGLYVVRTSVSDDVLSAEQTVSTYKDLSQVESAFRSLKNVDLHVRPIYHWKDDRINRSGRSWMRSQSPSANP